MPDEKVEPMDAEPIEDFNAEEAFTGADKFQNIEKLKDLLQGGEELYDEVKETVATFRSAGAKLCDLLDNLGGIVTTKKGEGHAKGEDRGSAGDGNTDSGGRAGS